MFSKIMLTSFHTEHFEHGLTRRAVIAKIPNNVLVKEYSKLLVWYDQVGTRMGDAD
jgi:hypothetical protein